MHEKKVECNLNSEYFVIFSKAFLEPIIPVSTHTIFFQYRNPTNHGQQMFFSRPLPKAGRELQTELNTMMNEGGGPLAKMQVN